MEGERLTNREIASRLERVAELLERDEENPFRVRSYRNAAEEIRALDQPVAELYDREGRSGLQEIPGIGEGLAGSISQLVDTGHLGLLDELEAERDPEAAFRRLPGIGPELARRIHDRLGLHTLAELELAAHDGRLATVEGVGEKRAQGVRDALAGIFGRSWGRGDRTDGGERPEGQPPVELLLEIDREYRREAEEGELRRIAPRRFNPKDEAWLPVMEVERDGWEFRVLFSNTRRAHELGRTHDWVVIYYDRDGEHGQATVVTARSGPLESERVVRGREAECREFYDRRGRLECP